MITFIAFLIDVNFNLNINDLFYVLPVMYDCCICTRIADK